MTAGVNPLVVSWRAAKKATVPGRAGWLCLGMI